MARHQLLSPPLRPVDATALIDEVRESMEPEIQIGDHTLTNAQAMAVRVAITAFHAEASADVRLHKDVDGKLDSAYRDRLAEVLELMSRTHKI